MLFLIANPIGGIPAFVALVKDFDFHRQRQILLREAIFSGLIAYFLLFLGEPMLQLIHVQEYAVRISGGVLVFLVSLTMIFPTEQAPQQEGKHQARDPFIVPIAAPLITGGGVFATLILLSKQEGLSRVAIAIFIAWIVIIPIVVASSYLRKILGKQGLLATEQLMGMLLAMLALEILTTGLHMYVARAL
jgi:multiple antibiotic resistance protein